MYYHDIDILLIGQFPRFTRCQDIDCSGIIKGINQTKQIIFVAWHGTLAMYMEVSASDFRPRNFICVRQLTTLVHILNAVYNYTNPCNIREGANVDIGYASSWSGNLLIRLPTRWIPWMASKIRGLPCCSLFIQLTVWVIDLSAIIYRFKGNVLAVLRSKPGKIRKIHWLQRDILPYASYIPKGEALGMSTTQYEGKKSERLNCLDDTNFNEINHVCLIYY